MRSDERRDQEKGGKGNINGLWEVRENQEIGGKERCLQGEGVLTPPVQPITE